MYEPLAWQLINSLPSLMNVNDSSCCSHTNTLLTHENIQESQADAGVSARQSHHLAINYELGFSTAIEALTCAATWRKR